MDTYVVNITAEQQFTATWVHIIIYILLYGFGSNNDCCRDIITLFCIHVLHIYFILFLLVLHARYIVILTVRLIIWTLIITLLVYKYTRHLFVDVNCN